MFKKILIANRGEIACRIIKTAKRMGIATVAIYSTIDNQSQHVYLADEAFWVGESDVKSSYLNIDAIISVAKQTGSEAIHPGYGFLSENPAFHRACTKENIIFIGPSLNAMEAMASKQLAKQLLEKTNVPLTPGYHGTDQTDEKLRQEAQKIGFPVLLKAANGGGGKGMRAVYKSDEFAQALASARREALSSFADDTMIIEKLVLNPRHIEVQIMADNQGQVVHLFERDCSIQRRHQKIIEEAAAPKLSNTLRRKVTDAACEVARSIHYQGAGTVEFLVDSEENFYFMEMNTRLQVEHPVTEMITGLDLVAWQILIADNQPLPCSQKEITLHGHAIECRIYAEDPTQDFIPSIGKLTYLKEPTGDGIRIDTGVACGSHISQYYDPMIAKLITWGENREHALQRMQTALQHFFIAGVKTNIPFLRAICEHPRFIKGELGTDFLTKESIEIQTPDIDLALLMAASYDYLLLCSNLKNPIFKQSLGWQMHLSSSWVWTYRFNHQPYDVTITPSQTHQLTIAMENTRFTLNATLENDRLIINNQQQTYTCWVHDHASQLFIYRDEGLITLERSNHHVTNTESHSPNSQLTAPMPATIVAILKKPGEKIQKGERLIVLEAMKMEHTIHAPKDGILKEIFYELGSQVHEGAELLTLE